MYIFTHETRILYILTYIHYVNIHSFIYKYMFTYLHIYILAYMFLHGYKQLLLNLLTSTSAYESFGLGHGARFVRSSGDL